MFFLSVLLVAALASTASAFKAVQGHQGEYSVVTGFFKQDDPSTNATTFDYHDNLGLYDNLTWPELKEQVENLNANAPLNTTYKVIYFGRHAEGVHNVVTTEVGTEAWKCYYCKLYGNGKYYWGPDSMLTAKGRAAAVNNSKLIKSLIPDGFPLPQSFYSSPLSRCGDTLVLTWQDLVLNTGYVTPIFKESLRETIGIDTADIRRSKTYLKERYPNFDFEANFSEEDPLWKSDVEEVAWHRYWRARQLLDDVFTSDESTFISFTGHSDIGVSVLSVLGHREFALSTGAIIPIVVRRESRLDFVPVVDSIPSDLTSATSYTAPTCASTVSITSIASDIAYSSASFSQSYSLATVTTVVTTTAIA